MALIVDPQALSNHVDTLRRQGWRGIVHIQGSEAFCLASAQALLAGLNTLHVEWFPDAVKKASVTQYIQQLLGTETDVLVINAWQGFNPNVLGASAACIRAGGLLLLLTPPAQAWPCHADPDYRRMLSPPHLPASITGRFIRHILRTLEDTPSLVELNELDGLSGKITMPELAGNEPFHTDFTEQQDAVAAIKHVANGRAGRHLVLQAGRGRGKSSALGIAAAQLLVEKPLNIVVTAPHSHCVQLLFHHAAHLCNGVPSSSLQLDVAGSVLQFMAVDALVHDEQTVDLLLVDEAAAIPAALLEAMTRRYRRIVFSTTTDGYEGNGQGFALRFLPQLQQRFPQTRVLALHNPLRYAANDPLEQFCQQALLLKSQAVAVVPVIHPEPFRLDRDELLNNQSRLQQVFGLLVLAHYQTTPDDLRLLLDHPDISIYTLEQQGFIIAVALVMKEGGFAGDDYRQLAEHRRRYRGHLLPQTLALGGFPEMLAQRTARVLRIAVLPQYQRRGFGQQLLAYVEQHCDADFIGASFSAEWQVLCFWQAQNMQALRLGVHKESSTGQYACAVLKPLRPDMADLHQRMRQVFAVHIPYQLLAMQNDCHPVLAIALLQEVHYPLLPNDHYQLQMYLQKRCSFEVAQAGLYRALLALLPHVQASENAQLLLVQKLLLNQSWQSVCTGFSLAGRAQAEAMMHGAWQLLLSRYIDHQ